MIRMRTIIGLLLMVVAMAGASLTLYAAGTKYTDITVSGILTLSGAKTLAQINALTPKSNAEVVICSDCTRSAICVSSGTTKGAWTIAVATGTFVGANRAALGHCQ